MVERLKQELFLVFYYGVVGVESDRWPENSYDVGDENKKIVSSFHSNKTLCAYHFDGEQSATSVSNLGFGFRRATYVPDKMEESDRSI